MKSIVRKLHCIQSSCSRAHTHKTRFSSCPHALDTKAHENTKASQNSNTHQSAANSNVVTYIPTTTAMHHDEQLARNVKHKRKHTEKEQEIPRESYTSEQIAGIKKYLQSVREHIPNPETAASREYPALPDFLPNSTLHTSLTSSACEACQPSQDT